MRNENRTFEALYPEWVPGTAEDPDGPNEDYEANHCIVGELVENMSLDEMICLRRHLTWFIDEYEGNHSEQFPAGD